MLFFNSMETELCGDPGSSYGCVVDDQDRSQAEHQEEQQDHNPGHSDASIVVTRFVVRGLPRIMGKIIYVVHDVRRFQSELCYSFS